MNYYFQQLPMGPMENFVYLIGDPETKAAAVIDPGWDVPSILNFVKEDGYHLTHAILTHGHYDHINGVEEIVDATEATVCVGKRDLDELIYEGGGGLVIPRGRLKKIDTEDTLHLGALEIQMIPTPGHTPGSRCILVKGKSPKDEALMTGDTLFVGTVGRSDFPYSSPRDYFQTIRKLKALPDETVFYPGHDYGASKSNTIGREKKTNPFLLTTTIEDFLSLVRR